MKRASSPGASQNIFNLTNLTLRPSSPAPQSQTSYAPQQGLDGTRLAEAPLNEQLNLESAPINEAYPTIAGSRDVFSHVYPREFSESLIIMTPSMPPVSVRSSQGGVSISSLCSPPQVGPIPVALDLIGADLAPKPTSYDRSGRIGPCSFLSEEAIAYIDRYNVEWAFKGHLSLYRIDVKDRGGVAEAFRNFLLSDLGLFVWLRAVAVGSGRGVGNKERKFSLRIADGLKVPNVIKDKKMESALFTTIEVGDIELAQLLIEKGVNVNCVVDGGMPLQMAACWGRVALVHMLIDAGANVNARDDDDLTALSYAKAAKRHACVKALQDCGGLGDIVELRDPLWVYRPKAYYHR